MRIETIGNKKYLVVKHMIHVMSTELRDILAKEEDIELIDKFRFEEKLILDKAKLAVSDIIASVYTQIQWHDLGDDESRSEVLGQFKLLKTMISNLYHLDKHELQVCYDEVDERLGDYLKSFGYDSIEDL